MTPAQTCQIGLKWLARILSVLVLGVIAMFVVGEGQGNVIGIFRGTQGMCMLFPFCVCVGMLLAWRWDLAGSLISLGSLGMFYLVCFLQSGRWPGGPWFLVFTSPAILFLVSWAWAHMSHRPVTGAKR